VTNQFTASADDEIVFVGFSKERRAHRHGCLVVTSGRHRHGASLPVRALRRGAGPVQSVVPVLLTKAGLLPAPLHSLRHVHATTLLSAGYRFMLPGATANELESKARMLEPARCREPAGGLEPPTTCLQDRCAAICATPASLRGPTASLATRGRRPDRFSAVGRTDGRGGPGDLRQTGSTSPHDLATRPGSSSRRRRSLRRDARRATGRRSGQPRRLRC
jgi:hypothetical protein